MAGKYFDGGLESAQAPVILHVINVKVILLKADPGPGHQAPAHPPPSPFEILFLIVCVKSLLHIVVEKVEANIT